MFVDTFHFIVKHAKVSFEDYKRVGVEVILFQIVARCIQFIFLIQFNSFIFPWVIKTSVSNTLVNFDVLRAVNLEKAIPILFIFCIGGIVVFSMEYLGIIAIMDDYHTGREVSLRYTLWKISRFSIKFVQSLFFQMSIYIGILLLFGFGGYTLYSILPSQWDMPVIIISGFSCLLVLWNEILTLTYVNFKIFDKQETIFALFDFELTKQQRNEIWFFSIIVLLTIIFYIFGFQLLAQLLYSQLAKINSLEIVSFCISLLVYIFFILGVICSIFLTGWATVYRSRVYHETFHIKMSDSKKAQHFPTLHYWALTHKKAILSIIIICSTVLIGMQTYTLQLALQAFVKNDFVVMAHRGGAGKPENTGAAFNQAINQGVDFIETDVQMTRDGFLVMYHDQNLEKVNSKSNAFDTSLEQFISLGFSEKQDEQLISFDNFLQLTKDKINLNIELKIYDNRRDALVDKVLETLEKYQTNKKIILTSLDNAIINAIEQTDSRMETGLIITASIGKLENYQSDWFMVNNLFYSANEKIFDSTTKKVALWSFSQSWDGQEAFSEALDAAITDRPGELQSYVNNYKKLPVRQQLQPAIVWGVKDKTFFN
jgi:glycerophosphoryl diester phosphodiesterase